MIKPEQNLTGGAAKVQEYVDRFEGGDEGIMKGLPESFRAAVEAKLNLKKDKEKATDDANLVDQEAKQETRRMAKEDEISSADRANRIRAELGMSSQPAEQALEALTAEEESKLTEEIRKKYNEIGLRKRMVLSDEMFMVSKGVMPETDEVFQTVDGDIGINYDAHGVAKTQQLEQLLNLLDNGISKDHDFYTAPFEVPADSRAGLASALGTSGGTAYKDGLAVLTSGYKETLQINGIKHVFINDVFGDLKGVLEKRYPQYSFHLLSEQKKVLEGEAKNLE